MNQTKKINQNNKKDNGITVVALIISVVIIIILSAVTIRNLIGNEGVINRTEAAAIAHKREEYKERINKVVYETVLDCASKQKIATIDDIVAALNKEDWIKSVVKNEEVTEEVGDITVTVSDSYVYQLYY